MQRKFFVQQNNINKKVMIMIIMNILNYFSETNGGIKSGWNLFNWAINFYFQIMTLKTSLGA